MVSFIFTKFIVLFLTVLFASFLQTSTGFGFSIVGTPFLLMLYPVHTAIQINIVLSIIISLLMIYPVRKEVDRTLVLRLIKGSSAGLIIGIFIYLYVNLNLLKLSIGLIIGLLTILLLLNFSLIRTKKRDYTIGALSGMLTTSIGVPGPPLLLYFSGTHLAPKALRSSTLAYYLFVYSASLVMQMSFGGTSKAVWQGSLISVIPLLIGIYFGHKLFYKINRQRFRKITYVILIFTSIYLIITAF